MEYAELLYKCGASLYYKDNEGRLPCDVEKDTEARNYITSLYGELIHIILIGIFQK